MGTPIRCHNFHILLAACLSCLCCPRPRLSWLRHNFLSLRQLVPLHPLLLEHVLETHHLKHGLSPCSTARGHLNVSAHPPPCSFDRRSRMSGRQCMSTGIVASFAS